MAKTENTMKKMYEIPELDVIEFENGDIITTSVTDNDPNQGEWDELAEDTEETE